MLWRLLLCFSKPWLLPVLHPPQVKTNLLSLRELCVCVLGCVGICARVDVLHAHLCCLSVYKEKCILCCLFVVHTGLPLFHIWKIPQPLASATKHRALSELYSICVIRQKMKKHTHTRENDLTVTHQTQGPLVYFICLWQDALHCV